MRAGLIIVGIVFWFCVSWSPLGELAWRKGCEAAQSRRYLNGEYTSVFNGLLNRGEGMKATFSILKQKPFYYFATESDTVRLKGFNDDSFHPLNRIDFEMTFSSFDIYDEQSIRYMLNYSWEPSDRFLMEVRDETFHYVAAAKIVEAQLDFDPETERIVYVNDGWIHTYIFYEAYGSYWQHAGTVSVIDHSGYNEPDLSLPGFVALTQWSHGTYQSAIDKNYYRLLNGRLEEAFSINASAFQGIMYYIDSIHVGVTSETELVFVNASETFVEHHIKVFAYSPEQDSIEHIIKEEIVTYSLMANSEGKFLPNKTNIGFNYDDYRDSTYFFPEAYAYEELRKMKDNGSAKQKELLKDFVYDSTATFR